MLPFLLFGSCAPAQSLKASPPKRAQPPLQARLDVPLDSKRTLAGSPVYASLLYPWPGADCSLAKGSVVSGHITHVAQRAGSPGGAEVTLSFDRADCNGQHNTPVQLLLYAIVEPVENDGPAIHDRAGLFGSTSPHPVAGQGPVAHINTSDAVRNDISGGLSSSSQPNAIKAGQVLGETNVGLDFSKAAENISRLYSARRDFRINAGAELILIAAPHPETAAEPQLEHRASATEPAPAASEAAPNPPAPPVDETEICAANCSEFTASHVLENANLKAAGPLLTASILPLGYRPTQYRPRSGFDHETTLSFLSNDQLLLTFDTHHLRERTGEFWHAGTRRSVRAALLDARSLRVQRVLEWQVDDDGQYLWKAGLGRVLVHRQGALHLVGADLHEFAVFPAHGDLLWVASSPSGGRIAFAVQHERHGRDAHETIRRLSGVEPVEDVELQLVDSTGKVLLTRNGDTTMIPPVLTDEGELLVQDAGASRWRLVEQGTEGTTTRRIATLTSTCQPRLSLPLPNGIFVVGCDAQGARWFRLLRKDGHAVLTSRASEEEIEQAALAGERNFAVHVVTLTHASNEERPRSAEELESERIQVRRERDGKLLLETVERRFPPSQDGYALSPDGLRLATLTKTEVEVRAVN